MLLLYKFSLQVGILKEEYQRGFQWTSTGVLDLFLYFSLENSACVSSELLICVFECLCVHAELLQSCPTLCDPVDSSPPGSSVQGIL